MKMPKIPVYSLKILFAVGLPTALAVIACLAAATAQNASGRSAEALAQVAFGRGEAATRLERQTLLTAHHLRGYALTGERHFLEEAKKELAVALTRMQELKASASRAGGVEFAEEAERVAWLVDAYKKAAEAIVGQNEAVAEARNAFEAAGNRFADLAEAYAARKKAALVELAVKYPPGTLVRAVSDKIFHALDLAGIAREVLAAEAEAGRVRRPEILRAAMERLGGVDALVEGLRPQASEADIKDAMEIAAVAGEFDKAAGHLAKEWELLHASGRTLALAERDALEAASRAVESAAVVERKGMEAFASELTVQKSLLWTLLVLTLAFGVVWIVLAVRFLGIPVSRCAAFAFELATGRVPKGLSVSGRDEVGILAESLREVSRRFGRSFAR
ncbi:hypothetical protein G3N56_07590 [Desulfovibrio sulfodismutans]|uniref:HAMP domain-containing protein n=1 Tax=Desulfolutivibrio sulfodismutans TaxID=63561 RepID=A0A7K3NK77_9BACT|nr:hypothetical protein [Desulfolutivibrio sulfodismutans]NDY56604.1 hypothetical protein [Desulfolutivibrio sulfodismutans]